MDNTIKAFVLVVAIVFTAAAYLFLSPEETFNSTDIPAKIMVAYTNVEHGISFTYPDTYILNEMEVGNGERWHYNITLIDKEAAANVPQNGEGPISITIDIFQNNLDKLTIAEWVNNVSYSNFKLILGGALTSITLADKEALAYTWDGLYRGDSIVFEHDGNIVMLSVTYLSPEDDIISDFVNIALSLELTD